MIVLNLERRSSHYFFALNILLTVLNNTIRGEILVLYKIISIYITNFQHFTEIIIYVLRIDVNPFNFFNTIKG